MPPPSVVFALTGNVFRNSRALKQLRVLTGMGCSVDVLTFAGGDEPFSLGNQVHVHVLPKPEGGGPRFFWQVHRLFSKAARTLKAHVYHASDLYVLPAMVHAARRVRARVAYDAREMYPHVASTIGRPGVTLFWDGLQCRYIRQADVVFTVNDSIARWLSDTYGVPPPVVLHNVPEPQSVIPSRALRRLAGVPDDLLLVLHQGQMRKDRGCALLVDAMQSVHGAALVFLGGGPLKSTLQAQAERLHLADRVRFLDPVPPDDLLPLTASADLGVTLLEDTCLNHRYALPNKLFEYLMAGLPVLASDLPEIGSVVRTFDVGCVVDPGQPEALVRTLQHMIDDSDAQARWRAHAPAVFETFSWALASQHVRAAYNRLLFPQPA